MKKNFEIKIFIIIAFLLLICPIMHLTNEKISTVENRNFAPYKPLYNTKSKTFNWNFGLDFNKWLSDRFFLRTQFININNNIKYYLSGRFSRTNLASDELIIDKKRKILYRSVYYEFYSLSDIKEINTQLKLFNEYCTKRNIKLFLIVVPPNKIVYPPEYFKDGYKKKVEESMSYIDKKNINLILPLDEVLKERDTSTYLLYYKVVPHMTLDGTFICYELLMENIKKEFSNVKILTKDDFNYLLAKGCNYLGVATDYKNCEYINIPKSDCNSYYNTIYRYYEHKDSKNLSVKNFDYDKNMEVFYYPKGNDLKIMLFGDSFVASLKRLIPYSFKNTVVIRPVKKSNFKLVKYYSKEIDEFNPDILVIYICYNSLNKLKNLMINDSN